MIGEDLFKALDRFGIVGLDGDGQRILARLHGRDDGWEANLSSRLREFDFEFVAPVLTELLEVLRAADRLRTASDNGHI
jgi:hypothetical protein